jgi:hypothetical protein
MSWGNREDTLCRLCDERFELVREAITPCAVKCSSARSGLIRSELLGIEAERAGAGTLDVGKILGESCGRESREFLAVERAYHRPIAVLRFPLLFNCARNGRISERQFSDNGEEIGVFVHQFSSLAFEPPDGRLELGCLP